MSDDHPNAAAYRRTVDAFRNRDLDTVASLVAEDVVWHVPGDHPLAGDYVGRERLLEFFAKLGPLDSCCASTTSSQMTTTCAP